MRMSTKMRVSTCASQAKAEKHGQLQYEQHALDVQKKHGLLQHEQHALDVQKSHDGYNMAHALGLK